jgi:hypothetical protein
LTFDISKSGGIHKKVGHDFIKEQSARQKERWLHRKFGAWPTVEDQGLSKGQTPFSVII